ncbi:hypothetical protein AGMMS49975_15070 [Clostridia bacterium]|nr:hypothetical protein AGMMS49975_15070 [Clostridia bacterium]
MQCFTYLFLKLYNMPPSILGQQDPKDVMYLLDKIIDDHENTEDSGGKKKSDLSKVSNMWYSGL